MTGRAAQSIEKGTTIAAAAAFAGAAAFALVETVHSDPVALVVALALFGGTLRLLVGFGQKDAFTLPHFEAADVPVAGDAPEELHLGESDRLSTSTAFELLLDDPLIEPASDARVVQLFDPASLPTAGQLQANIERRLRGPRQADETTDDSRAFHEALAELRRSMR